MKVTTKILTILALSDLLLVTAIDPTDPPGPVPLIIVPKPGDPGNCNGKQCTDNEICAFDFSSENYFDCMWTIADVNGTVSTEIIPGQCDPITRPPSWGADGSRHSCLVNNLTLKSGPDYRCVCTTGACPKEELKICEEDHLLFLTNLLIAKLIKVGDQVNIGDACNATLDQQIPHVIQDYDARTNYYKMVHVLGDATDPERSKLPLCNRRRLMTCIGDKCDCVQGTAQREVQVESRKYYSYYCYATSGSCDRDPFDIMPQFQQMEVKIHNHYGSPKMQGHRDPKTGCLYNLCKNVTGNKCSV